MKKKTWIIIAAAFLVLAAAVVAVLGFLMPYLNAKSEMPTGVNMSVTELEDGTWELTFPNATQASYYLVEFYEPYDEANEELVPEILHTMTVEETSFILPELPDDRDITLRITPVVEYNTYTDTELRYGENNIHVTAMFKMPKITKLVTTPDSDSKTVSVAFEMGQGEVCTIHRVEAGGEKTEFRVLNECETVITFGDGCDMPMPTYDETYTFTVIACRNADGIDFYGKTAGEFSVLREDLLGRDLALAVNDEGENVFSFTWQETKGEYYKVQVTNEYTEDWVTVCEIPRDGERSYQTPHLEPFETYEYRVLAIGGQTLPGKKAAAESEVLSVTTKESAIFATIWPVKDLDVYSDTSKTEVVGTAIVGTAYCVLDDKDGMFAVRVGETEGYIDRNYCLINLPDYIGSLCEYNITNSYSTMSTAHEYAIPNVTGVVASGYKHVRQSDGSFLVPLIFPTAQKLLIAAETAAEKGYKLKIYDAFRPYVATREKYDQAVKCLDDPIPEYTYRGVWVDLSELDLPEPEILEDGTVVEPEITYELLITNNKYNLSNFLARTGSSHNHGIALDLTFVNLETGKEVRMQTSMHDLSWYSSVYRNTKDANTLRDVMKGAGFVGLSSEWWHFQDNDSRDTYSIPSVTYGISAEGWIKNDYGWRYRDKDGDFYTDTTVTIGETEYAFDENGYVIE